MKKIFTFTKPVEDNVKGRKLKKVMLITVASLLTIYGAWVLPYVPAAIRCNKMLEEQRLNLDDYDIITDKTSGTTDVWCYDTNSEEAVGILCRPGKEWLKAGKSAALKGEDTEIANLAGKYTVLNRTGLLLLQKKDVILAFGEEYFTNSADHTQKDLKVIKDHLGMAIEIASPTV